MAREKEWEKQVVLEREKVELEEKLNELQRYIAVGPLLGYYLWILFLDIHRLHDSSIKDAKSEVDRLELATNEAQSQKVVLCPVHADMANTYSVSLLCIVVSIGV